MNNFDKAIYFATKKHSGAVRKLSPQPYILHPMEVASIAATMTSDIDTLCAALLHDVVEDAGVSIDEIKDEFGPKVAELVASETENKFKGRDPSSTWQIRKEKSLEVLKESPSIYVKILWLSDKLSNMRSFYRLHLKQGDDMWNNFHQNDIKKQEWYYRSIAELLSDLKDFTAYQEYLYYLNCVFKGEEK